MFIVVFHKRKFLHLNVDTWKYAELYVSVDICLH